MEGANANSVSSDGETPLTRAACSCNNSVISSLLKGRIGRERCEIDGRNRAGATALLQACKAGYPSTVSLLLSNGAFPDMVTRAECRHYLTPYVWTWVWQTPNCDAENNGLQRDPSIKKGTLSGSNSRPSSTKGGKRKRRRRAKVRARVEQGQGREAVQGCDEGNHEDDDDEEEE